VLWQERISTHERVDTASRCPSCKTQDRKVTDLVGLEWDGLETAGMVTDGENLSSQINHFVVAKFVAVVRGLKRLAFSQHSLI